MAHWLLAIAERQDGEERERCVRNAATAMEDTRSHIVAIGPPHARISRTELSVRLVEELVKSDLAAAFHHAARDRDRRPSILAVQAMVREHEDVPPDELVLQLRSVLPRDDNGKIAYSAAEDFLVLLLRELGTAEASAALQAIELWSRELREDVELRWMVDSQPELAVERLTTSEYAVADPDSFESLKKRMGLCRAIANIAAADPTQAISLWHRHRDRMDPEAAITDALRSIAVHWAWQDVRGSLELVEGEFAGATTARDLVAKADIYAVVARRIAPTALAEAVDVVKFIPYAENRGFALKGVIAERLAAPDGPASPELSLMVSAADGLESEDRRRDAFEALLTTLPDLSSWPREILAGLAARLALGSWTTFHDLLGCLVRLFATVDPEVLDRFDGDAREIEASLTA